MSYFVRLCEAMAMLAAQPRSIFIGQAVAFPGTAMYGTLRDVPAEKRLELPVAEDMQMGMATGLALAGELPICIYPRINFMLLAVNQLVLHLDKMRQYSRYQPKVIIRTAIATNEPLDPGPQHLGDYSDAMHWLLQHVKVQRIMGENHIAPTYQDALARDGSTLIIEYLSEYNR
jgi:pyruvate/2-oxoglutarate/acetoin dehydrogenase E1 component